MKRNKNIFCLILLFISLNSYTQNNVSSGRPLDTEAVQLKVMTWNIWGRLNQQPRYSINGKTARKRMIKILRESKADIITMTETYGSAADIAKALQYHYYTPAPDANLTIFSRYPLQNFGNIKDLSPFSFIVATAVLPKGKKVRIYNIWLTSGGRHIKEIKNKELSDGEFTNGDQNRYEHVQQLLQHPDFQKDLANKDNVPLIVAGDFNCVPHLDYTPETKAKGLNYARILPIKTSLAMEKTGFVDSYRFVHPEITKETLGHTWTTVGQDFMYVPKKGFMPNTKKVVQNDRDPYARIDYIYSAGKNIRPVGSRTILHHSSNKTRSFPEFPSDHGAVLTTFKLQQNKGYNVRDYGAKGDGTTLDTWAIQTAIDKCTLDGGGQVFLPSGTYLTGCIVLKNNVDFHLSVGAVLLGSSNRTDYKIRIPSFESRTNDLYVNRSIIYAENAENVSLTGNGIIDGNGTHKNYSITNPQKNRPFIARFIGCKNLTIRDVSMLEAANWTCHLLGCEGVLIDGLKIKNSVRANRDGLDIDGCKDVTVSNCRIASMDDAIVLKSTGPAICENINITNCHVSSHASGIKMGTETTGGFKNINIVNCTITNIPTYSGIALMIVDGGSMKNININNITMNNVNIPFMVRLGNRARAYKSGLPTPETGSIENIGISNVIVTNAGQTSHITGLGLHKKRLKNISFNNITVDYNKSYKGKIVAYNKVPLKEADYPSGQLYGTNLPASAFYFRNVTGLKLNNIDVSLSEDARIPIVFDQITNLQMLDSRAKAIIGTPLLYIRNVENGHVGNCSNYENSSHLAVIEKENCSAINIEQDKLVKKQKTMDKVAGLPDKTYEDIKGFSDYSFSKGNVVDGLPSYSLKDGSVTIPLKAVKGKAYKLMFLNYSEKRAEDIIVTINGEDRSCRSSDTSWGWSIINVSKITNVENIKIKISRPENSGSEVFISKVSLVPVALTD